MTSTYISDSTARTCSPVYSWPFSLRANWSPFPISITCRSDEEAAYYARLKPAFDALIKLQLTSMGPILAAVSRLMKNPVAASVLSTSRVYFTVLYGNGGNDGIFLTW